MYLSCIAYAMYHRYYKKNNEPPNSYFITSTPTQFYSLFAFLSSSPSIMFFKRKINKCTNISDHSGRLDQAPLKCLYQLVGINFSFYYRYGRDCESYSWLTLKSCPDVVTSCFLLQAPSLTESLNYSLVLQLFCFFAECYNYTLEMSFTLSYVEKAIFGLSQELKMQHQQNCQYVILGGLPKKNRFFLGDLSQMWVGGVADSQTRSKPLKTPQNHLESRPFRPKFHLSFSQISQKPWGG